MSEQAPTPSPPLPMPPPAQFRPISQYNETIAIALAKDGSGGVRLLPLQAVEPAAPAGCPPSATLEIRRASLLHALGLDEHASAQRFHLRGMLGMGATGQVYEVDDADLARATALKVLQLERPDRDDLQRFIREAQITASLTHPHILPIYDIDQAGAGRIYFTMPKIAGYSLGSLLSGSGEATARPIAPGLLDDANALVTVAIAITQVLAYAHHRQVVHQDIKPDNIMIGEFGEVWLLDWGSAVRMDPHIKPSLYGTPLYMSPEQARAERVDCLSDIYCLGATMFHALMRRCPTWDPDPDVFWAKKRSGTIDPPSPQERARAPAVLLDIALKAMAADPASRYASAEALLGDLKAYQSGQAVTAHREGVVEYARRLWRAHGRRFAAAAAVIAVIAVLVGMLYGERLQGIARWGRPILVDDFAGTTLDPRWRHDQGEFRVANGRLESMDNGASRLLLDRHFSGPTAIEYDAEVTPGSHPGDISLIWCSDRTLDDHGHVASLSEAVRFQVGAYDGAFSEILDSDKLVAFSNFKPAIGRTYHIRDEIIGDRVSLSVDGRQLCAWQSPFPLDQGYLEFLGIYPGHAFSHLRVYSQGTAQKIPATAIGDALVDLRRYEDAAHAYARVATSFEGTELGREALLREGLCRWRLKQWDAAFAAWAPLRGTPQQGRVALYGLQRDFAERRFDQACAGLEQLYADASPEHRHEIALAWGQDAEALCLAQDHPHLQRFLAMHDRCLAGQAVVDGQCADCLQTLGEYQQLLARFPTQQSYCAYALDSLQRWSEIVERYPDQMWYYNLALLHTAQDDRIEIGLNRNAWSDALLRSCRFEELAKEPNCEEYKRLGLIAQGKFADVDRSQPPQYIKDVELSLTGHVDEDKQPYLRLLQSGDCLAAQKVMDRGTEAWQQAQMRICLDAYIAGGGTAGMDALKQVQSRDDGDFTERIASYRLLLVPFLKSLRGGWGVFDAALTRVVREDRYRYQQQMWYAASYLTGAIDDRSFLAQPHRLFAQARLTVLTAMRAERHGRTAEAVEGYRAWQTMPAWQRDFEIDPSWTRFVAWRIEQLATHP